MAKTLESRTENQKDGSRSQVTNEMIGRDLKMFGYSCMGGVALLLLACEISRFVNSDVPLYAGIVAGTILGGYIGNMPPRNKKSNN